MPEMYSPFTAVRGYDRTHIKRLTVAEYLREVDEEERDVAGPGTTMVSTRLDEESRQYERRRCALTSRHPNVVFSSKYPIYDRLGRELCVLYQMQDIAVQQECRRVERDGAAKGRRSGVRLSAELLVKDSETSIAAATGGACRWRPSRLQVQDASQVPREGGVVRSIPRSVSMPLVRADSRSMGRCDGPSVPVVGAVRLSEPYSIYRDSQPGLVAVLPDEDDKENQCCCVRVMAAKKVEDLRKRQRSTSQPPCGQEKDGGVKIGLTARDASLPPRPPRARTPTPPPLCSAPTEEACGTFFVRPSALPLERTTRQLFRLTQQPRPTTTLKYSEPIRSHVYGVEATSISARLVCSDVETNLRALLPCLPQGSAAESSVDPAPILRSGRTYTFGQRHFRLTTFYAVASVFVGVEVEHPPTAEEVAASRPSAATSSFFASEALVNVSASSSEGPSVQEAGPESSPATDEVDANGVPKEGPSATYAVGAGSLDSEDDAAARVLVYRWRSPAYAMKLHEGLRAAVGISLCASDVRVETHEFTDGGVTMVELPRGWRAVPLSGVPLSSPAYATALRCVLRMLSDMVARRVVHGNLPSLGELLLAFPRTPRGQSVEQMDAFIDVGPKLFPVHWERMVDFSMFADRQAGRSIPYNTHDEQEPSLLTCGSDIAAILQCFLEHRQSHELNSEQHVLLQRLVHMTGEPTQVSHYLVQVNALIRLLPNDLAALRTSFDTAASFYCQA